MAMGALKSARDTGAFSLNITSLMDILTIVLIYLVMGFSSEENEVDAPKDIALPQSTTQRQAKVNLTVSVSLKELRVEGVAIASLEDGKIPAKYLGDDKLVTRLLSELQKDRAKAREQAGTNEKALEEAEVIYIESDKAIAYETLDKVMKTAAGAGFTRFRLASLRLGT